MPFRWQAKNYNDLLQETWDNETFVFNPASGHTHVLNATAIDILSLLSAHASSLDDLINTYSDDATTTESSEIREALKQQISQLHTMGLIQKVP